MTHLCMKFEFISFNTFEVMPRTRFCDAQTDRVTPVYPPNFVCGGLKSISQKTNQDPSKSSPEDLLPDDKPRCNTDSNMSFRSNDVTDTVQKHVLARPIT